VEDLLRYALAVAGGVLLTAASLALLAPQGSYSLVVYFLFAVFLFFSLAASRSSFRVLDRIYGQQAARSQRECVLLYGAGDMGELALRWLLRNPASDYQPLGFLDEDPMKWGRRIHGVEILGGLESLGAILEDQDIEGILITGDSVPFAELKEAAQSRGLWVRRLRFEFELLE
jgi:UDP-GlcNAc:undecaprenyl-phosphate GlcNAc-1-phosphate transferase